MTREYSSNSSNNSVSQGRWVLTSVVQVEGECRRQGLPRRGAVLDYLTLPRAARAEGLAEVKVGAASRGQWTVGRLLLLTS